MPRVIRSLVKPGNVATVLIAVVALGALFSASVASLNWSGMRAAKYVAPLTNDELAVSLLRVGLSPEACCAAGLDAIQVDTLVDNARDHLDTNIAALRLADEDYITAKANHDQLKRLVQSGKATPEQLTEFQAAATTLATKTSTRESALSSLYAAAIDGLAGTLTTKLGNCQDAIVWAACPVQYRVESRSEADWVALRDALADIRISNELGESPAQASIDTVNTADADPDVSAAATALSLNLTAITNAWNDAVYPGE